MMHLKFRPKLDKIVEALLYLAHKRPGADKYQVVKLFYLADREHLIRFGRPITQELYFALPYGPVASKAMDLMEGDRAVLREVGLDELPFAITEKNLGKKIVPALGRPFRDVDIDLFSRSDFIVLDEIVDKYGDCSFEELYELTHEHYAYKRAWDSRKPHSNRSPMFYEDMIEDEGRRQQILDDIGTISEYME